MSTPALPNHAVDALAAAVNRFATGHRRRPFEAAPPGASGRRSAVNLHRRKVLRRHRHAAREDWEVPFFFYGHAENFRGFPEEESEGLLGCVDGGTLFVDHVQIAHPQRALEALHAVLERGGQYQRVGDPRPRTSTFVVLAATNEDPEEIPPLLRKHLRRRIATPALAEHREDIPLLIRMELRDPRRMAEWDSDPSRWTEYARVLTDPHVIERLLRADYRDSGVFGLQRHMIDEVDSVGLGLSRSIGP